MDRRLQGRGAGAFRFRLCRADDRGVADRRAGDPARAAHRVGRRRDASGRRAGGRPADPQDLPEGTGSVRGGGSRKAEAGSWKLGARSQESEAHIGWTVGTWTWVIGQLLTAQVDGLSRLNTELLKLQEACLNGW